MEESHLYCILSGLDKYSMQDPVNRGRRVQWSRYAWYRIGAVECSIPVGDLSAVCALTKIDLRVPMSMTNQSALLVCTRNEQDNLRYVRVLYLLVFCWFPVVWC